MDEGGHTLAQKHGKKQRKDKISARVSKSENEKRRRAQENRHIEDIAELIADTEEPESDAGGTSEKPDKFAILEKADRYLQKIQRDSDETASDSVIQQSQVSSSGKSSGILSSDVLGALLLEVLDGFLFLVDRQGKVQFTSDQITQYLDYTKDELVGNSIYNIIDTVDHAEIAKSLVPLSSDGNYILCSEENMKNRKFNCKLRKKGDGQCFVNMQLQTFLNDDDRNIEGADAGPGSNKYLVCVAQKVHMDKPSRTEEFFITKQDLQGQIISCDTTGLSSSDWMSINLVGQNIKDFCQEKDRHYLQKHHNEVLKNGTNTSKLYHFKLHEKRSVFVQTNSQLFKNPTSNKPEFIMSTHIVSDPESNSATDFLARNILGSAGNRIRGEVGSSLRMGTKNAPPPPSAMGLSLLSDASNAAPHPAHHSNTIIDHFNNDNDLRELLRMFQGGSGGGGSEWEQSLLDTGAPGGSGGNYSVNLGGGNHSNQGSGGGGGSLHSTQVSWSSLSSSISSTNSSMGGGLINSHLPGPGTSLPPHPHQHSHPHHLQQQQSLHHHGNSIHHHHHQQQQQQSPGYGPQRSPGFAGSQSQRSPGFTPSPVSTQQRSPHRSPAAATGGNDGFAPPPPALMMGSSAATGGGQSSLQALQTFDANLGKLQRRHNNNSKPPPYKDPKDPMSGAKQPQPYLLKDPGQTAKLRQLLENDPTSGATNKNHFLHNMSPSGMMGPRFPFSKDSSVSVSGGGPLRTLSRSSSISSKGPQTPMMESPRPRPSPSSETERQQQEPQSTSRSSPPPQGTGLNQPHGTGLNQPDPDSSRDPRNKPEDNKILKELLESNDDEDDENSGDGCQQASSTSNIDTKEKSENEAEPKKTDNLLIKLLNESQGMDPSRVSGGKSKSQLLQHLLLVEDEEDEQRTPAAESTSTDDIDSLTLPPQHKVTMGVSSATGQLLGHRGQASVPKKGDQQVSTNQAELRALLDRMWNQQTDEPPVDKKPRLEECAATPADSTETDTDTRTPQQQSADNGPAAKNRMLANLLSKSTVCDEQLDLNAASHIDVSSTPQPRQGSMIQSLSQLVGSAPSNNNSAPLPTTKKGPGRPPGSTKRGNNTNSRGTGSWAERARLQANPYSTSSSSSNTGVVKDKMTSMATSVPLVPGISGSSHNSSSNYSSVASSSTTSALRESMTSQSDSKLVGGGAGGLRLRGEEMRLPHQTQPPPSQNPPHHTPTGGVSSNSRSARTPPTTGGATSTLESIISSLGVSTAGVLDSMVGGGPPTPPSSEALILQEAAELEQDLVLRRGQQQAPPSSSLQLDSDDSALLNSLLQALDSGRGGDSSAQNVASASPTTVGGGNTADFSQQDLESLLNLAPTPSVTPGGLSEQQAINDIQQQLMSMDPGVGNTTTLSPQQQSQQNASLQGYPAAGLPHQGIMGLMGGNATHPQQVPSQQQPTNNNLAAVAKGNAGQIADASRYTHLATALASSQGSQLPPSNHPTGMGPSPSNAPKPAGGGMSGAVRPALLMQQHQKRLRHQMQSRLALQQRGFSPGGGGGGGVGYPQARNPTAPGFSPKAAGSLIPNNFSEIMNSTIAPNVSLERNQAPPGPMSPQFPPSHPPLRGGGPPAGGGGANRMQYSGAPQWNQRANQAMMTGGAMVQASRAQQFNNISPRQMGPSVPMPPQISPEQAQFPDPGAGQFTPQGPSPQPGSQMMLSPQQQHMRARQMALQQQGLHSPHGPQQQYPGNTGLLNSHQKLSPNNQISPQQQQASVGAGGYSPGNLSTSPNYQQAGAPGNLPQGYSASLLPGGRGGISGRPTQGSSGYIQTGRGSNQPQQETFVASQQKSPVGSNASSAPGGGGGGGNTASKLVRQQLQGFLTTRVQQQLQATSAPDLPPQTQPPPEMPPPQPPDNSYDNGEIPRHVLDTINELSELGQGCPDNSYQEEINKEAKERCRQFEQLSYQGNDSAASSLFRSQLLSPSQSASSLPDLLPAKPDTPVVRGNNAQPSLDLPKSQQDQVSNSLLQKLLSDDT